MGVLNSSFGHNLTGAGNISGMGDLWAFNNTLTDNLFGVFTLLVVWVILFVKISDATGAPGIASLVSSFMTLLLTVLLTAGGLVIADMLILNTVILIISMFWVYLGRRETRS